MEYLTLSHCWGGKDIYKLTTKTMDEMRRRIRLFELPQSFRDAIAACQKLGRQ